MRIVYLFVGLAKEKTGLGVIRFVLHGIFETRNGSIGVAALHVELAHVDIMDGAHRIVLGSGGLGQILRGRRPAETQRKERQCNQAGVQPRLGAIAPGRLAAPAVAYMSYC